MAFLDQIAALGRGKDNKLAHVGPDEVVVPKEIFQSQPQLLGQIQQGFNKFNEMTGSAENLMDFVVGRGKRNEKTGLEEFAIGSGVAGPGIGGSIGDSFGDDPREGEDNRPVPRPQPRPLSPTVSPPQPPDIGGSFEPSPGGFPLGVGDLIGDLIGRLPNVDRRVGVGGLPQFGDFFREGEDNQMSPARREALQEGLNRLFRPELPEPLPIFNFASGMSPLQQRTAFATRAIGGDSRFTSPDARSFYSQLLRNTLITDQGETLPLSNLTPIENQFISQVLGITPQSNTRNLLNAIANA